MKNSIFKNQREKDAFVMGWIGVLALGILIIPHLVSSNFNHHNPPNNPPHPTTPPGVPPVVPPTIPPNPPQTPPSNPQTPPIQAPTSPSGTSLPPSGAPSSSGSCHQYFPNGSITPCWQSRHPQATSTPVGSPPQEIKINNSNYVIPLCKKKEDCKG